ncbi:MAG: N(4)-(beta-N-acetylglucosaminyl)-L-asparaginase [Planctomycetes bacterium]|nr:N(4)-(beta-N-acetylglucosaminyl)-L-asparaginase [Planctomycetota bacterium]
MLPPKLSRHPLLASVVLGLAGCSGAPEPGGSPAPEAAPSVAKPAAARPLFVATWPFGKLAVESARHRLLAGGDRLDAVEAGIREIERRSSDGSVGLGARPNAAGYVQLDACIMDGVGHRAGAVAAVEGIVHPITLARRVMESSRHVMLVGEGARWFALEQGLESVDVTELAAKKQAWVEREREPDPDRRGHDTIALLVLDADGDVAGGCSTSGAGGKLPGRVGDSPILGAGLYVDNEVGAAGATGLGENIMRYCATFWIVELMRQGLHPQAACEEVIHRMARLDPRGYRLDACFIALDKAGRFGAAASNQRFPFAVATTASSDLLHVEPVAPR